MLILSVLLFPPVLFLLVAAAARGLVGLGDLVATAGRNGAASHAPHGA